jgi:hypothetical protein
LRKSAEREEAYNDVSFFFCTLFLRKSAGREEAYNDGCFFFLYSFFKKECRARRGVKRCKLFLHLFLIEESWLNESGPKAQKKPETYGFFIDRVINCLIETIERMPIRRVDHAIGISPY